MATRDDSMTPDTGPMLDRRTLVKGMAGALAMSAVGGSALVRALPQTHREIRSYP